MRYRDYDRLEAAESELVELRIHGVGGTPPEVLLNTDAIGRVRGDDVAGFYREDKPPVDGSGPRLEAYSWGGLTSKSWTRALWVLLAPFALVNVAGWMLPSDPGPSSKRRWAHRLATIMVRLVGLHVTLMVVAWFAEISVGFAAFQCGGSPACRDNAGFLRFLGWSFFAAPGRRIALGAIVPVVIALALWLLSRVARGRYEAEYPFSHPVEDVSLPQDEEDSFADPTLWKRSRSMRSFATLHLTASLAFVGWIVSGSVVWVYGQVESASPGDVGQVMLDVVRWGSVAVLALTAVAVAGRAMVPAGDPPFLRRWTWSVLVRALLLAAIAALTASVISAAVWPATAPRGLADAGIWLQSVPSTEFWPIYGVFVTGVLFVVGLALHPNRRRRIPSPLRRDAEVRVGFGGWGSLNALLLAYLVALLFLAGLSSGAARFLGGRPRIDYPVTYEAYAVGTLILLVFVLAAVSVRWWIRSTRYGIAGLHSDFPAEDTRQPRPEIPAAPEARVRWLKTLRRSRVMRLFIRDVEAIIAVAVAVALAFITLDFALRLADVSITDNLLEATPAWLETAAAWLMAVGVPLLVFFVVRRSFSSRTARKTVGMLWDVTTFWPRWHHPLAPPSYAGRAVPELRTRLDVLAESGSRVILSAHSQGSVLAVAALDGLRGEPCFSRIGLVTHGSPVGRLYLTYFPAQLAPAIERVHAALNNGGRTRWVNLYRLTDPIGGAIGGEETATSGLPLITTAPDRPAGERVANPINDPDAETERDRFPRPGDPYPLPRGHSDYYLSPEYQRTIELVAAEL